MRGTHGLTVRRVLPLRAEAGSAGLGAVAARYRRAGRCVGAGMVRCPSHRAGVAAVCVCVCVGVCVGVGVGVGVCVCVCVCVCVGGGGGGGVGLL